MDGNEIDDTPTEIPSNSIPPERVPYNSQEDNEGNSVGGGGSPTGPDKTSTRTDERPVWYDKVFAQVFNSLQKR